MLYIETALILIIYIAILVTAYILKKRASQKIAWWEILIFLIIGIFSFDFNFEFLGTTHKFAFFPLGAALFYFFTRKKQTAREKYRPFVWVGFVANYAFFIIGILTIVVTNALFPPEELSTYIKSLNKAQIGVTHISADQALTLKDDATELLHEAILTPMDAHQWYNDQALDQRDYAKEKFPYILTDVTHPAGMNVNVLYFVEQDGKGILIQTPPQHYYYRITVPIVQNVGDQ